MKTTLRAAFVFVAFSISSGAFAQHKDSLLLSSDAIIQQFDSLFNSEDSLSIFRLLDSVMQMPDLEEKSQVAVRLGYNSNVVALSRTIGLNQFGLAPGVSYYHKSGLYADAATYWSQQYCPSIYLTVLSGGYLKTVGTHWSFLADYNHYFYTNNSSGTYNPYTNNAGVSNYFELRPCLFRVDYYLYFGQKTAHRLSPGISLNLQKRKFLGFDRVSFYPGFNVLLGTEDVITTTKLYANALARLRMNKNLPPAQQLPLYYDVHKTEFGAMNYSFSASISFARGDWNALIGYTYNIPKSLPHENVSLQNGGYLSASITRYIARNPDQKRTRTETLPGLPGR